MRLFYFQSAADIFFFNTTGCTYEHKFLADVRPRRVSYYTYCVW